MKSNRLALLNFYAYLLVVPSLWTRALANGHHTCLYQADFAHGTKIISESGTYRLCEDIVFGPAAPTEDSTDEEIATAFDASKIGGDAYNVNEYALGYFSALVIAADDVTLFLNGYSIQQSQAHALMQRFFAVIELASSPFLPSVGPAQFVSGDFVSATNFRLLGPGVIGRSSHHGIHGNNNAEISIQNVVFRDFEVAAVSLNNVKGLSIQQCDIPQNRQDVPILGSFSAARQILPYVRVLKDTGYSMMLKGVETSSAVVYEKLVTSIANVYKDVMDTGFINQDSHPDEYKLFNNPHHVVDGPCYAFLVHGKGPAVGGQGFELAVNTSSISMDVDISNNKIENIKCFTNEVPATVVNGVVQNDARGAILQLVSTLTNEWLALDNGFHYTGNVVADAQIMAAKAIQDGSLSSNDAILQTEVSTISQDIISWAESRTAEFVPEFRCNGDSMHHVVKGAIMIRVEDTQGFTISGNTINLVKVVSNAPSTSSTYFDLFVPETESTTETISWTCSDYHKGASIEDGDEQQLANLRGISVAAVKNYLKNVMTSSQNDSSKISGNTITNFDSENANIIVGIDVQGISEGVLVKSNDVDLKVGVGVSTDDQYIAFRARKYASVSTLVQTNRFAQEEVIEVINEGIRRKLRSRQGTTYTTPDSHPKVESEWEYGGCPFGRA